MRWFDVVTGDVDDVVIESCSFFVRIVLRFVMKTAFASFSP